MRGLLDAWQDMDAATPAHRVLIPVLLLVLLIAAGLGDGPA